MTKEAYGALDLYKGHHDAVPETYYRLTYAAPTVICVHAQTAPDKFDMTLELVELT